MTEIALSSLAIDGHKTESADFLAAADPHPVGVKEGRAAPRALIVCDHAGNAMPAALGSLGVDPGRFGEHIAFDLGALGVARGLADQLGATLVFGRYSRLAADLNRAPDDTSAIPVISDGVLVPGNLDLDGDERSRRISVLHNPYHEFIAGFIASAVAQDFHPVMISIHSFTPRVSKIARPWEAGVLWDKDPRLAIPLLAALRSQGILVGDNEPYSGRHTADYTLDRHAEGNHLAHVAIEIRQDCIASAGSQHIWAERIAGILRPMITDETLYQKPVEAGSAQ